MAEAPGQFERTIALGDKALAHIRSHRCAAHPRAYEFWYAYVSGNAPSLTRAVNEILTRTGTISQSEIDDLYDRFLHASRSVSATQKATSELLTEMQQVDVALAAARDGIGVYRRSLHRAQKELEYHLNVERLQRLCGELTRQTNEAERTNTHLSDRLAAAMDELSVLRDRLESVRVESLKDPVTTLINRQAFDGALVDTLARTVRTGSGFSLLMIDIDFFKAVNDTFGHLTGDQVLRLVAQTIRHNLKGHDIVARFGGEEFVVILPDTDMRAARTVAENLRLAVMSRELVKRSTGQNLGRVTVSIGIACYHENDTPENLIERADRNLYAAKRGGRNMVVSLDEEPAPSETAAA